MSKLNKNNRGFSLVELIIVIAIMSIMAGVVGFGFSMTNGKPAEECARKLTAAISHGRTATFGKYRNTITVRKESDGKLTVTEDTLVKIEDDGTEVNSPPRKSAVGAKGVEVAYEVGGTGSYTVMAPNSEIQLRYDSGSGAMKATAPGGQYYTGFRISRAGKTWYVELESQTGRVAFSKDS